MARHGEPLTCNAYIKINGENVMWYSIDGHGNTTWYLSQELTKPYVDQMLENMGKGMNAYLEAHPESALWNDKE